MARRARKAEPQAIRLELAPRLGGREALGRHDALLMGQVIAATPLAAIAVTAGGTLLARLDLPAGAPAAPAGFQLALARRAEEAALGWCFTVHVTTADGATLDVDCAARREPGADGGVIERGPIWSLPPDSGPLPPLIAYIERAALDPAGTLALTGWSLGLRERIAVQAYLGLDRVGSARLRQPRDDIARHYPAYPAPDRSGFALTTKVGAEHAGARAVTVTITEDDGTCLTQVVPLEHAARLDPPPSTAPGPDPRARAADRRRIHHHFDRAEAEGGVLHVEGWAASAVGIDTILVQRGEIVLGEARLGLKRSDVAAAHPTLPMARHAGFAFAAPLTPPITAGEAITLAIRTPLGDEASPHHPLSVRAPETPASASEFRLEIDRPILADGAMAEPVTTRLTIEGWALARHAAIEGLTLYLDGQRMGEAHTGLTRPDVERALPDWPGALRCGFAYHVPPRLLRPGGHRIRMVLRAADGTETERGFDLNVQRTEGAEDGPVVRTRLDPAEIAAGRAALARLGATPKFHIRIEDAAGPELAATLASLIGQSLPDWRAEVAAPERTILAGLDADPRIVRARPGVAGAFPGESVPDATFCAVLRAGDTLDAGALAAFALEAAQHPEADLLYADEIRRSPVSGEREAFFKPGFSPDLLLSWNYIGRAWVATAALLRAGGAGAAGADDRMLRLAEQASAVVHVPRLLLRAADLAADAAEARAARAAALGRAGAEGEVAPGLLADRFRIRRRGPTGPVSILIPTNFSGGHVETCIASLRGVTARRDFEIICIENIPPERAALRGRLRGLADQTIAAPAGFNWSHFNNLAAAAARGQMLLFLNDDIEAIEPDWLDAMLEAAADPAVGVVGARLLYPDRTVQHAGMFLAGAATGRHAFRFAAATDPGPFGLALTPRNVSAVTGAAMLMRRSHFDALGGFDAAHQVINNDLDFCLRTLEAGRRVVVTPHATLIHHELASRGRLDETYDLEGFARRWRSRFAAGDPFHNPNLSTDHDDCRGNDEPILRAHGGGGRIPRAEVRRILAVKLDHIGDFITALPAIRRLKAAFPAATIHALVSPAAVPLVALEPAIDEAIPFAFFHARSALGLAEADAAALAALDARLAALAPDLAIDLRKHLDTRDILRRAGARWNAGYDHMGQFPWLDIALEWEADRALAPKRAHIAEDLQRLVAAVDLAATEAEAPPLRPPPIGPLPAALGALFDHPVIAVHPGAGNPMKQWPVGHFVALLGLVLARHPVRVVLIGGPDEAAVAGEIAAALDAPDRVGLAVGVLGLGALPGLLARSALFIGNDSGPKHIAAALGVPTVGIHSGSVDATEWGPRGPGAIAISRAMSCAPCYINKIGDCPRDLACIRGIDPGAVYGAIRPLLAALTPPVPAVTTPVGTARPRRRGAR